MKVGCPAAKQRRYCVLAPKNKRLAREYSQVSKCVVFVRTLAGMKSPSLASASLSGLHPGRHLLLRRSPSWWRWASVTPYIIIHISHRHIIIAYPSCIACTGRGRAIDIIPWGCLVGVRVTLRGGLSAGAERIRDIAAIEHDEPFGCR